MGKVPSRGVDQFVLRFPDGLRDQIRGVAERNGRSMNAEIIARLEETFEGSEKLWGSINRIEEAVEDLQRKFDRIGSKVDSMWSRPYDDADQDRD